MKATIIITSILQLLSVVAFWTLLAPGKRTESLSILIAFIVVAVGLLKRRNWARVLTRLLGVLVLIVGGMALVSVLQDIFRDTSQLSYKTLVPLARTVIISGIGLWWFLAFRSARARQFFLPSSSPQVLPATSTKVRPTSISIIAVCMMLYLLCIPIYLMMPQGKVFPLMGMVVEGVVAQLFWIISSLVGTVMGYGLWRMKEWARIGTLMFQAFSIVNGAMLLLKQDVYYHYMEYVGPRTIYSSTRWSQLIFTVVAGGAICYCLIINRAAFQKSSLANEQAGTKIPQ
jgi:hypothetical protein